jgi:hypothetical protein
MPLVPPQIDCTGEGIANVANLPIFAIQIGKIRPYIWHDPGGTQTWGKKGEGGK